MGMPSRVNWLVMGGPTAHPTGVTLASGDPPNSLNVPGGTLTTVCRRKLKNLASRGAANRFSGLLAQQALQDGAGGAAVHKVALFVA